MFKIGIFSAISIGLIYWTWGNQDLWKRHILSMPSPCVKTVNKIKSQFSQWKLSCWENTLKISDLQNYQTREGLLKGLKNNFTRLSQYAPPNSVKNMEKIHVKVQTANVQHEGILAGKVVAQLAVFNQRQIDQVFKENLKIIERVLP